MAHVTETPEQTVPVLPESGEAREGEGTDTVALWTMAAELGEMIKRSVCVREYLLRKEELRQDAGAQAVIREFVRAKEKFEECERFGRFHPDYREALDRVQAWQRKLDEVETIRKYKAAEEALGRLLYEVSLTLARAVSDTVKVPYDDAAPAGCGTGGRCMCAGDCYG